MQVTKNPAVYELVEREVAPATVTLTISLEAARFLKGVLNKVPVFIVHRLFGTGFHKALYHAVEHHCSHTVDVVGNVIRPSDLFVWGPEGKP